MCNHAPLQPLSAFAFHTAGKVRLSSTERVESYRNPSRGKQTSSRAMSSSGRVSRKKYAYSESSDDDDDDDDDSDSDKPSEPPFNINTAFLKDFDQVDKVIGRRSTSDSQNEFLLKFVNFSYREAEWVPESKAIEVAERKIQVAWWTRPFHLYML